MKIEKKQWLLYAGIVGVAILIVILAITINTAIQKKKESEMNNIKEQLVNLGGDYDKVWNLSDEEASKQIQEIIDNNGKVGYTFDSSKKEYSNTEEAIKQIHNYIINDDYSSVVTFVNSIKNNYNFTTSDNMYIINAGNDASKLTNLKVFTKADYESFLADCHNELIFLRIVTTMAHGNFLKHYYDYSGVVPYYAQLTDIKLDKIYQENDSLEEDENYLKMKSVLDYTPVVNVYKYTLKGYLFKDDDVYGSSTCYVSNVNHDDLAIIGCYSVNNNLMNANDYNELIKNQD